MPILNLGYHCNSFGATNIKDKILVKPKDSWLCLAIETMIHAQIACLSLKQLIHSFIFNCYNHEISFCNTKEHYSYYAYC